ncbi:SDR family oxidoreductase [Streptomyces sp. NPDC054770]
MGADGATGIAADVTVLSDLFTVQKALPLLTKGSSVILCGSAIDVKAVTGMGVYAATKAAVRSRGRTWAAELVNLGIRVNVLARGATNTAALAEVIGDPAALMESLATAPPMNRIVTPEETANVVVFRASDNSSFMTGSEIYVDGGHSQL